MCNIRSDHLYANFFYDCKVQPYTKMIITFPFNRYAIQLNLVSMEKKIYIYIKKIQYNVRIYISDETFILLKVYNWTLRLPASSL